MKITDQKIEVAAAKSDARYYLTAPWVERDDDGAGRLIACDGHILAVLPADLTADDVPGPVSIEAIKAGRKLGGIGLTEKGAKTATGNSYARPDHADGFKPVEWRRIVPPNPGPATVCLDAELVIRLARAL